MESYRNCGLVVALVVLAALVDTTVCNIAKRPGDQAQENEYGKANQPENEFWKRVGHL
jgi:hypothetical protein